jgi:UDP-N-acetylglucosamine transferase subunit ALG13
VIFVTLGTQVFQFDRLLRALDAMPGDEPLVVQCRRAAVRPRRAEWHDYLSYEDLLARLREARVVVCHAGVGSVLTALEQGRRPVVVPRLHAFGEAVDDHQLPFARRLAAAGHVTLVEDVGGLAAALERPGDVQERSAGGGRLARDLGAYLQGVVAGYSR